MCEELQLLADALPDTSLLDLHALCGGWRTWLVFIPWNRNISWMCLQLFRTDSDLNLAPFLVLVVVQGIINNASCNSIQDGEISATQHVWKGVFYLSLGNVKKKTSRLSCWTCVTVSHKCTGLALRCKLQWGILKSTARHLGILFILSFPSPADL